MTPAQYAIFYLSGAEQSRRPTSKLLWPWSHVEEGVYKKLYTNGAERRPSEYPYDLDRRVVGGAAGLDGYNARYSGCLIGVRRDLWCWGANNHGQSGSGTPGVWLEPTPQSGIEGADQVTVYNENARSTAYRLDSGRLSWSNRCAGSPCAAPPPHVQSFATLSSGLCVIDAVNDVYCSGATE